MTTISGLQTPLVSAVRGLQDSSRTIAEAARKVAANGIEDGARNFAEVAQARAAFKANAAVIRAADETSRRLLDILV